MKRFTQNQARDRAFTLIELLIVVAIIAILAAIAVPNFLEAQTRSKVAAAKADMRTLATGLEAYRVDNQAYPLCNNFSLAGARFSPNEQGNKARWILEHLSTPIAYLSSGLLPDPFPSDFRTGSVNSTTGDYTTVPRIGDANDPLYAFIKYDALGPNGLQDVEASADVARESYFLMSTGPATIYLNPGGFLSASATATATIVNVYDPTNGTVSRGSIFRVGGSPTGAGKYGNTFYETVPRN